MSMNAHSPQKFDKFTLRSKPISKCSKIYSLELQPCIHLCMCAACSCQLGLHISTELSTSLDLQKRSPENQTSCKELEYPHNKGEGPPVKGLRLASANRFPR